MAFLDLFRDHLRRGSVFHVPGNAYAQGYFAFSDEDTFTNPSSDYFANPTHDTGYPQEPGPVGFDQEHAKQHAQDALNPAPQGPQSLKPKPPVKIFRDGFKNFLFGEDASLSKTLATYLVAPLFIAAYPLARLSNLIFKVLDNKSASKARFFLLLPLIPMIITDFAVGLIAKMARGILRVALTPVAELFNVVGAAINALRGKVAMGMDDQPLPVKETVAIFLGDPAPPVSNDFSPIIRKALSIAPAIWTLGVSLLVERFRASHPAKKISHSPSVSRDRSEPMISSSRRPAPAPVISSNFRESKASSNNESSSLLCCKRTPNKLRPSFLGSDSEL